MKGYNKDEEQLIVDFIHNRLVEEEVILVNEKIRTDKDFAERLAFASAMKIGTQSTDLPSPNLKRKLLEEIRRNRRRESLKRIVIGSIVVGFLAIMSYFLFKQNQLSENEKVTLQFALKEQIKQEYDINVAAINESNKLSLSGPELVFYDKIKDGLGKMKNKLDHTQDNLAPTGYYYGATLLLFKNKSKTAIKYLELAVDENSDYRKDAYYYMVIAYTLERDYEKANTIIKEQAFTLSDFPNTIKILLVDSTQ